jgi:TPR repeat protein
MRKSLVTARVFILASAVGAVSMFSGCAQKEENRVARAAPRPTSPEEFAAMKKSAEGGDASAQTKLGWIYQKGDGVKADAMEAVKWFRLAADQNYPDALAALGEVNQAGQGVPRNLAEAARLYRLAAEKGSVAGQYNLAYLYEQGSGVNKDEKEATKWYRLAADGGDALAQYDIGQRFKLGIGIGVDNIQACKWLLLSSRQGQADAAKLLHEIKPKMTRAEISQAEQQAADFKPRVSSGATPAHP